MEIDIPGLPFAAAKLVDEADIPRIWLKGDDRMTVRDIDAIFLHFDLGQRCRYDQGGIEVSRQDRSFFGDDDWIGN